MNSVLIHVSQSLRSYLFIQHLVPTQSVGHLIRLEGREAERKRFRGRNRTERTEAGEQLSAARGVNSSQTKTGFSLNLSWKMYIKRDRLPMRRTQWHTV